MVDKALGVVIGSVLNKVLELVAEEIGLAWGVKKELRKLADKLEMIQALLDDAQGKQFTSKAVQLWLKRLQSFSFDVETVLDDFGYELLRQRIECNKMDKVRSLFSSSNALSFRLKMAHKIRHIISSLDEFYTESSRIGLQAVQFINSLPGPNEKRLTVPYVEDSEIVGREHDIANVISMLTGSDYERDLPVITVLGMGGQGKTTLAQLVYKSDLVKSYFDQTVWICVSDDFSVQRLLGEMLQSLTEINHQLTSTEALVNRLQHQLRDKRYLLVLDDVWNQNADKWNRMRSCLLEIGGSRGSKILATTRIEDVALSMRSSRFHRLGVFSEDQSWELFKKCAFAEGGTTKTPQLVEIGKRVLKRCGGVPLAIKALGGLLYSKNSESEWSIIDRSETWNADNGGDLVLPVIKLSYDHLPSLPLKQCFASCAIFEKDTVLEKGKVIQFWMAQGLLNPPNDSNLQMEDIGEVYFNILLRSSLFHQETRKVHVSNITTYTMHDLVHDFSLQVSRNYCLHMKDWKLARGEIEAVHLSICSTEMGLTSSERDSWKSLQGVFTSKLRTLFLKGLEVSEDLFRKIKCLTVLIVENKDATKLPDSISLMKHLRFLDVSQCFKIRRLPKSVSKLYYLQTLRVFYLTELPKGFGNLINLKQIHMGTNRGIILFPELGKLTNLQTLPYFKVGNCEGSQMKLLEKLDNLRGTLRIWGLQNIATYETAAKSNLSKKTNIQALELKWDRREQDCDDIDVMEGLRPHANLKALSISGYRSPKFPSWMVAKENGLLLLRNMVKLTLASLDKCERLPSLGDLPFLENLEIRFLHKVKCIGREFYGGSNLVLPTNCTSCASTGPKVITLFPALKVLDICFMNSLVEWRDATGIISTTNSSSSPVHIKLFPYLEKMSINGLPQLSVFPNLGCLPCLQTLYVTDCQNLTISSEDWNRELESLRKLESNDEGQIYSSAVVNSDFQYFPSLHALSIGNCSKFTATFCSIIGSLVPLKYLHIRCNPRLWPKDLNHLTSISTLNLEAASDSEEVELDCLFWPYPPTSSNAATGPVSLTSLTLISYGLVKVMSLPHQIQNLTSLTKLEILNFDMLEVLPEWLGSLEQLQQLSIRSCKNLKQLPSIGAFQRLTNLKILVIKYCPVLVERCRKDCGPEWPKIAHITTLKLK